MTDEGINCSVSEILNDYISSVGQELNRILRNILTDNVKKLVSHDSISNQHLNRSGIHLNGRGTGPLAYNFIQFIKKLDFKQMCVYEKLTEALMTEQRSSSTDAKKTGRTVDRLISGSLNLYCLNVNSLLKHLDELRIMADEHKPHIICLNETKLDNDVRDEGLATDGFHKITRKDRTRNEGGVAMYVKENLNFKVRHNLILDIESISIPLDINYVKPIIISTLYRPPDSQVELFEPIESLFSAIDQENIECIVSGDFNCDLLKPDQNNQKHIKLIYKTYCFKQFIDKPTRTTSESKTLIDHISSNIPECVSGSGVIPCGISDHDTVFLIRSMRIPKLKKEPKIMTVRKCKNFDGTTFLA